MPLQELFFVYLIETIRKNLQRKTKDCADDERRAERMERYGYDVAAEMGQTGTGHSPKSAEPTLAMLIN